VAEQAVLFDCEGEQLVGILSLPAQPAGRGVLIVVGGPQYRAGSHRQFTLLARRLAAAGVPCMRFDHRGMGDSSGTPRTFEAVQADLRCALDAFFARVPALREAVLWGLCDAASAALLFGVQDSRVKGLALLNPWVRSEATYAQAQVRHYYRERLLSPELWGKLLRGQFDWRGSAASLARTLRSALRGVPAQPGPAALPFPARMAAGLGSFAGATLLVISGNDLTAREFTDLAACDPAWQAAIAQARLTRIELPDADHTFSRAAWQDEVERATLAWLASW
jgi:exosortase A-associated hydrolase 1